MLMYAMTNPLRPSPLGNLFGRSQWCARMAASTDNPKDVRLAAL